MSPDIENDKVRQNILKYTGYLIANFKELNPNKSILRFIGPTDHNTLEYSRKYEVDGVIHSSCWGWPGLAPAKISRRYSHQVAPILLDIANCGINNLPPGLKEVVKFNS